MHTEWEFTTYGKLLNLTYNNIKIYEIWNINIYFKELSIYKILNMNSINNFCIWIP
jgi:hypothetical protein